MWLGLALVVVQLVLATGGGRGPLSPTPQDPAIVEDEPVPAERPVDDWEAKPLPFLDVHGHELDGGGVYLQPPAALVRHLAGPSAGAAARPAQSGPERLALRDRMHDLADVPQDGEYPPTAHELAVVIGSPVRRLNDVTCRDWQFRTREWLQGKNWEATTPIGPYLVTPDELPGGIRPTLDISTCIDGETVQQDTTADLLFDPVALVEYVSTMITLRPGDVIATGTPGGVGHARTPPRYLEPGQVLSTSIGGLGECRNTVVADA